MYCVIRICYLLVVASIINGGRYEAIQIIFQRGNNIAFEGGNSITTATFDDWLISMNNILKYILYNPNIITQTIRDTTRSLRSVPYIFIGNEFLIGIEIDGLWISELVPKAPISPVKSLSSQNNDVTKLKILLYTFKNRYSNSTLSSSLYSIVYVDYLSTIFFIFHEFFVPSL